MASAVLGNAARRLGGGALQQALAAGTFSKLLPAVMLGQQRVLQRFMHTEQQQQQQQLVQACSSYGTKPGKDGLLRKIQGMKEELYDLMTEADKTYETYGSGGDKKLFQCLSGHVQPRPHDPTWESNMSSRHLDAVLRGVGITNVVVMYSGLCLVTGVNLAIWTRS